MVEDYRTPNASRVREFSVKREASWSAVVLYRFQQTYKRFRELPLIISLYAENTSEGIHAGLDTFFLEML